MLTQVTSLEAVYFTQLPLVPQKALRNFFSHMQQYSSRPVNRLWLSVFPLPQGISRVKSSSDVVGAVMKELRLQSGQPESDFRLAVAVDGVNALWGRSTIKKEDKSAVRKHIRNPVMLRAASTDRKSYVSVFPAVIRWIQRSSLWFTTWGSWWRTTGWEKHTKGDGHSCVRILYFRCFFPLTFTLFVSDRRRHHHHSVSDGLSLHFKICLPASRAAGRGQRSFYCTLWSVALALKLWQQISLSFSFLTLVISQEVVKLTSRLHHKTLWLCFVASTSLFCCLWATKRPVYPVVIPVYRLLVTFVLHR